VIVSVLIVAALILSTPEGKSQELLPIIGLIAAALVSITGGMAYSASLLKNSGELYARWLERR
jgi:high-affinity Fe2+/Pb2+ permease